MGEDPKSLLGSSLSAGLQSGTSGAAAMALQVTWPIDHCHNVILNCRLVV